jgi:hypothetical protein
VTRPDGQVWYESQLAAFRAGEQVHRTPRSRRNSVATSGKPWPIAQLPCVASRTRRAEYRLVSPLETAILREIGADPARMSTRSTRVERQLHAVAQAVAAAAGRRGCPRVSTLLCASVREADPGRNQGQMGAYRGGICTDLAPERGPHAPVQPGSWRSACGASGANRAKQRWFSPADRNYGLRWANIETNRARTCAPVRWAVPPAI